MAKANHKVECLDCTDFCRGKDCTVLDWNILCDFDGTIALKDITDSLLERFARPGWETLESAWRSGKLGSRECMGGQVALLDASQTEIDAHLASMEIDPMFPAFVAAAKAAGISITIVSDGLDYAISKILARYALADLPIIANHFEPEGAREWSLKFPYSSPSCSVSSGNCKCACVSRARKPPHNILLIGDGASDFCAADAVDHVFAKARLIDHCTSAGIPHTPIAGFAEALALLPALIAGRLTKFSSLNVVQDISSNA